VVKVTPWPGVQAVVPCVTAQVLVPAQPVPVQLCVTAQVAAVACEEVQVAAGFAKRPVVIELFGITRASKP